MKTILSFITLFAFGIATQAQTQPCATSSQREAAHQKYPQLIQQSKQYRQQIHALMDMAKSDSLDTVVYTIPIVFHVIHEYGSENISDAQIYDEVRVLNEDYMKLNPDTNQIIPFFDSTAGKARIQFKLASLDPIGNPTNGITRRYIHESHSEGTNIDYNFSKYDRWPRSRYLNVWVVKDMSKMVLGGGQVAGYAYHPIDVVGGLKYADGVILLYNFVGSIGEGSPYNSRTLTHEVGHYLGLDHPWGPKNGPDLLGNCGEDDGIADTPNCEGSPTGVCDLSRRTCDTILDPVQNFMDYSYCSVMFSKDQVKYMRNVLRQPVSQRNNLWSQENLDKTVPSGVEYDPVADFFVKNADPLMSNQNNPFTCQGKNVTFSNASWRLTDNNATYSWKFQDATPATSTDENPSVVFNSPGWKDVTLTVTDNGRTNTITKHNFMYVTQDWPLFNGVHQFDFDAHPDWWITWNPEHTEYQWEVKSGAGENGSNAMFLNMTSPYPSPILYSPEYFFNVRREGSRSSFITQPMDFSYVTNPSLSFDWACATDGTKASEITEKLEVYVSYDCGNQWYPITGNDASSSISGLDLVNNGTGWDSFVPNASSTWSNQSFNMLANIPGKNHVQFKFVYFGALHSNNIAIDNINVDGTLGLNTPKLDDHLSVYPNPSTKADGWNIKYDANEWSGAKVKLLDMSGRIVSEGTLPNNQSTFNLKVNANLTNGVYILKIQNAKNATQKKLILK